MKPTLPVIAAFAALLTLSACGGSTNSVNPTTLSSQPTVLSSTDTVVGTGATAAKGSVVTVNYSGYLFDSTQPGDRGNLFDTSNGRTPFTFTLGAGQVIQGWEQGVVGMKVGGKRTLIIPASLGYGALGNGAIPGNAGLVFDIELLSVQ